MVHMPVSVDTFYSAVAEEAVGAGADMINDVSGGLQDPKMFSTVASLDVPYVLMHMRGTPKTMQQPQHTTYDCVWVDVGTALHARAQQAIQAGIKTWNLILDPGLGFAKTKLGNLQLLGKLRDMRHHTLPGLYGRLPMLVGPSRKGFLGAVTGECEWCDLSNARL